MDYTDSPDHIVDADTGNPMHQDTAPVTTVWSAKDANSILWSLMEVVKASGLSGLQFDKDTPASYQRFRDALDRLYAPGRVVESIAALRALPKTGAGHAFLTGYYAAGDDGGGGRYYYDPSDTVSSDNGGSVIVATDGGRWKLIVTGDSIRAAQFGAKADGTHSAAQINAALAWASQAGIRYVLLCGKTFSVNPATSPVLLRTGVVLDGCNGVLQRIGTNYTANLVQNANYGGAAFTITSLTRSGSTVTATTSAPHGRSPGNIVTVYGATQTPYNGTVEIRTTPSATTFTYEVEGTPVTPATGVPEVHVCLDMNLGVRNLRLLGNSTSSEATQSHDVPAANLYLFRVDGFELTNLTFDKSAGDNFGWRGAHHGRISGIIGGSFGRNMHSPTSGLYNDYWACDFTAPGLPNAIPGENVDVENDAAEETSETTWDGVHFRSSTFFDQHTQAGGKFAHKAQFHNCTWLGGSPRTLRIYAQNSVKAKQILIGDTCRVAINADGTTALQIGNVDDVVCDATLANDSGVSGTTRAIEINAPVSGLIMDGALKGDTTFGNGLDASGQPLTNSRFLDTDLGNVILGAGSSNNDFGGCTIANWTVSGAGSVNNRLRASSVVTGTKVFSSGASWAAQIIEHDSGTFTPVLRGSSTAGAGTYSLRVGTWSINGDMLEYSMEIVWTGHTGTGTIQLDLSGASGLPAAPIAGTRFMGVVHAGMARTHSYVALLFTGGSLNPSLYEYAPDGSAVGVPLATSGSLYVSGSIRIR